MDVESLYTNIAHIEGLLAVEHYLKTRQDGHMPPNEFILQLVEWTLTNNVFCFDQAMFKQIKGTAMGACFAPSYACLFLGLWEENHIHTGSNPFLGNIISYCRYIDDILLFFTGTVTTLGISPLC